jgi:glutathione S-transferase
MIEFVDVATAKAATGTRMVVAGVVPSPWSEAAKGLFRIAKLPVSVVRSIGRDREIAAWTGLDNVPVVVHNNEPVRSSWSAIVGLVARLAPGVIVPDDPAARAEAMGLIELIAGEDGIGWNGRLSMIHAGITTNGERGFAQPIAGYLANRYGYMPAAAEGLRDRVGAQLAVLATRLAGRDYFGGDRPQALDAYAATVLTPFVAIGEQDCIGIAPMVRHAFASCAADFGALVPAELLALRARMFERHLGWPIQL